MYCPKCRCEFREGFDYCQECDVSLVDALPTGPDRADVELVQVFDAPNQSALMLAESILDEAGIEHLSTGEYCEEVGALGALGVANMVLWPIPLHVAAEDAEEARGLLANMEAVEEADA